LKDPLLQSYTAEELATEYLMYAIKADPNQAFPALRDGQAVKIITGDDWFDKLDEKAAKGESFTMADFTDSKEAQDIAKRQQEKPPIDLEEFDERY
jgi:hypothetical protein